MMKQLPFPRGRAARRLRLACRALVTALCLTADLGCVTLFPNTTPVTAPGGPEGGAAPPKLAPAATAKLNLTVAQECEKNGHFADAVYHYELARQSDPGLRVARQLAVLYDRLGDPARALAEYQQALKDSPNDADVLNSLGYFHYNHGKWPEAEQHLRHALAVNGKHQRAWINLGLTLGEQCRYQESFDAFRQVVSEAEAHSNLAFVLTTQGKRADAQQEYRRAMELNPNLAIARRALDKLEHPGPAPQAAERAEVGDARPRVASRAPAGMNCPAAPPADLSPVNVDGPVRRAEKTASAGE